MCSGWAGRARDCGVQRRTVVGESCLDRSGGEERGGRVGRRSQVPPRARRRGGGRAAVCGRVQRAAAQGEDADLASLPGGDRRTRHLLRSEARAQPRDARRPRGDRRVTPARRRSMPATLAEIQRYTKLFWINSGPYNNLTAPQIRAQVHAAGVRRRGAGRREGGRGVPAEERRDARCAARAAAADVLRSSGRSEGHDEDAAGGEGHPHGEREQPVRRRDDEGSRAVRGSVSAELAAGEAGTASSSRRSTASAAGTARRSPRSSATSRRRSRSRPSRWRRRCAR